MTPTLVGRWQTRLVLMLVVAVPWTLIVAPLLGVGLGPALGMVALGAVLGLVWEAGYHALQQLRWDKDWPSLFALAAGLPEALLSWVVLGAVGLRPADGAFVLLFASTWLLLWLVQQGPLRVLAQGWRFHGARFVERHATRALAPMPQPVSPRSDLMAPEPAPEPEAAPVVAPVRAPKRPERPKPRRPRPALALPARRVAVAVVAAAVLAGLGWSISTTAGKDHAGSVAQAEGQHRVPAQDAATKGGPDTSTSAAGDAARATGRSQPAVPAAPDPDAQQPVRWEVPSDHKAYKTWNSQQRVTPYAVTIPRLQLQKVLSSVGLTPQGTIQTPAKPGDAAWYDAAAAPGQVGPGVLVGSMVEGRGAKTGVFARIGQLVPGDTVVVTRTDSTSIQFIVNRVQRVSFDRFPTRDVYGMTAKSTLRLVGYSQAGKGKGHNVIVYAKAVRLLQPKKAS